jgi:hypothetical protein
MKWLVSAVVVVTMVAGCGDDSPSHVSFPERDGQSAQLNAVLPMFGLVEAPPVDWVSDLKTCPQGGTGFDVDVGGVAVCSSGWTFADRIRVADLAAYRAQILGHELGHWMLIQQGGTGDGGTEHQTNAGPIWGPGGLTTQAKDALAAAGL